MKKSMLVFGLIMLMWTAGVAQASVSNLISNGNFEEMPDGTSLAYNNWTTYSSLPGWTLSPNAEIQYGLGWAQREHGLTGTINTSRYTELDSTQNTRLSQSVSLVNGASYTLSFDYYNRVQSPSGGMEVRIGENLIYGTDKLASQWENHTSSFIYAGATGSQIFSLLGTGASNTYGAYVDNVSLVQKPAATPLPAAVWLLGSGLMGLVGLRKKFKA